MQIATYCSRRRFLRTSLGGATALGIGTAIPACLLQAADKARPESHERILVVIQLSGGNDGLNTVVPYTDELYYAARPELALPKSELLKHDGSIGFHPSLIGFSELLEEGNAAIVQGVGYENPNRSHFESMDIWHTCRRKSETRDSGWLGRYLDLHPRPAGGDVPALHLGQEPQPLAVVGRSTRVPTVRELSEFQLHGTNREALRSLLRSQAATSGENNALLDFLRASTLAAVEASQRVAQATREYESSVAYPETQLSQKLRVVAQLIDAGLSTQVYYVQLDGFDTHAQQAETHAILLREWSDAVTAFVKDLDSQGHAERVCVISFSEFGRRVAENASEGTDHGAAAPVFLCGGRVRPGIHGEQPNLQDLEDGDLKFSTDFRQVYASLLEDWLAVDSPSILGAPYQPIELFSS